MRPTEREKGREREKGSERERAGKENSFDRANILFGVFASHRGLLRVFLRVCLCEWNLHTDDDDYNVDNNGPSQQKYTKL